MYAYLEGFVSIFNLMSDSSAVICGYMCMLICIHAFKYVRQSYSRITCECVCVFMRDVT